MENEGASQKARQARRTRALFWVGAVVGILALGIVALALIGHTGPDEKDFDMAIHGLKTFGLKTGSHSKP